MPKGIKLNKRLLGVLYHCVLSEMERVNRNTKPEFVDDLQSLELKISNLFKKI